MSLTPRRPRRRCATRRWRPGRPPRRCATCRSPPAPPPQSPTRCVPRRCSPGSGCRRWRWPPASAVATASEIRPADVLIRPMISATPWMTRTASRVPACTSSMRRAMSPAAWPLWWASSLISWATTAKPLPASPADVASIVAFSASRFVCSAIILIVSVTLLISPDARSSAFMAVVAWPDICERLRGDLRTLAGVLADLLEGRDGLSHARSRGGQILRRRLGGRRNGAGVDADLLAGRRDRRHVDADLFRGRGHGVDRGRRAPAPLSATWPAWADISSLCARSWCDTVVSSDPDAATPSETRRMSPMAPARRPRPRWSMACVSRPISSFCFRFSRCVRSPRAMASDTSTPRAIGRVIDRGHHQRQQQTYQKAHRGHADHQPLRQRRAVAAALHVGHEAAAEVVVHPVQGAEAIVDGLDGGGQLEVTARG